MMGRLTYDIGRCSLCGGTVTVQAHVEEGVVPVPTCVSCGANKKPENKRIIEMEQQPPKPQLLNE